MTPEFGFCFKPDLRRDNRSGPVHLRISHYGATRYVPTSYDIRHDEWNPVSESLVISGEGTGRHRKLAECAKSMERNLRLVDNIIRDLSQTTKRFTADDVANSYVRAVAGSRMLGVYVTILGEDLVFCGQVRVSMWYHTAVRRFTAFNDGYDIDMGAITPAMMRDFQRSLVEEKVSRNTISFYMRALRAIYNKAVAEGIIPPRPDYPFDEVYTQVTSARTNGNKTAKA